jgi:predicted alpha/beta superfamily hydrolase
MVEALRGRGLRSPLLLCSVLALSLRGETPPPEVSLVNTEMREITSSIVLGQTYQLLIAVPRGYAESKRAYPVLYVLDGWHFPLVAALADYSDSSKTMPPMIVVNVSYGRAKNVMDLRERDLTPTSVAGNPHCGGADRFLAFMERELIPYIDRTYRTDPSDRALLGHSYGGLFAMYALLHRPQLFQRVVSASSTFGWDNGYLLKAAPGLLNGRTFHTRLDLSAADKNDNTKEDRALFNILEKIKPAGLDYRFTIYPGQNHNSVRPFSFASGLAWVYRDWQSKRVEER